MLKGTSTETRQKDREIARLKQKLERVEKMLGPMEQQRGPRKGGKETESYGENKGRPGVKLPKIDESHRKSQASNGSQQVVFSREDIEEDRKFGSPGRDTNTESE